MAKKKQAGTVTKKKRGPMAPEATSPPLSSSKRSGRPDKEKQSRAKPAGRAGGPDDTADKPGKGKKHRPAGGTGRRGAPERSGKAASRTTPPSAPVPSPGPAPRSLGDVDGFLAVLESVGDPEQRYALATEALGEHVKVVELLSAVRGDAAAAAYGAGGSVRSLAQRLGVSPSRVHQLIQESQARAARSVPLQ